MRKSTQFAAAAAGLALSLGAAVAPATAADGARPEPCAKQDSQVTKAEGALAKVTEVFERQKAKVQLDYVGACPKPPKENEPKAVKPTSKPPKGERK